MDSRQPSASVLIPTWQAAGLLDRVLERLAGQVGVRDWEVRVVDSGSTDETLRILERWCHDFPVPMHVRSIPHEEFDHGDTRNALAAASCGEVLVFLTQDAIPHSPDWLATLLRNFDDPCVGAAYGRQTSRPDALWTTRALLRDDPARSTLRREVRLPATGAYAAMSPHERRLLYDFSNVGSAVRRSLWERHPFPRTRFGEDILIARAILEAGFEVVYDASAVVEHSHDDDASALEERAELDGAFNAEWLGRVCVEEEEDIETLVRRAGKGERTDHAREVEPLRRALYRGLFKGGKHFRDSGLPVRGCTAMLDSPRLHVLYVVHGFAPDTWAGTEIYTLELAQEMKRRGHRVSVFARTPAKEGGDGEFEVERTEFAGLPVYRMPHHLEHARLRESYREPRAEEALRGVIEQERPDVVHFQHLLHMSAGLVDVAKSAGLPTVMHAHDYWALCPRVQMIRPDAKRCERNMGLGCQICVRDGDLAAVPRWAELTQRVGPWADRAGRVIESGIAGRRAAERARAYRDLREREACVLGAYAANDLLIAPSRFLRDRLLETGVFDERKIAFSENGIVPLRGAAEKKRPDPEGRVRLGFIGSLVWYKGVDVLLRAYRRIEPAPVSLSIYGDFRPDEDAYHASLRGLASGGVTFHGRLDRDRLSDAFAQIDVLVVPSVWFENCPTAIREAFLASTPVVTSELGGMAESVRDGVDGLLFPAGDDAALATCLARFVSEPRLLEVLSRDFPPVKSMHDDAALCEARYRSLVTFAHALGSSEEVP